MPLDELVALLVTEHKEIAKGSQDLGLALPDGEYQAAKETLIHLDSIFRQNIADEVAQIVVRGVGFEPTNP